MMFSTAGEALSALVEAYYDKRDVVAALDCVTDDIKWIGTEDNDSAFNKDELRELLTEDVKLFPDSFGVELKEPIVQIINDDAVMFFVSGEQLSAPGVCGFIIRGTACAVRTEKGWLINSVHTSVPNSEVEKISLQKKLFLEQEKQAALLNGVPGGVAMYRVKKDGRIPADYISDGIARICGYNDIEAFTRLMNEDSRKFVLEEDYPIIAKACRKSIYLDIPTSVNYRVHAADGSLRRVTLDAIPMKNVELGDDDVAVFYAVQTPLSEDVIRAKTEQDYYRMILDITKIAYFDIDENMTFYASESFSEYKLSEYGINAVMGNEDAVKTIHPDDFEKIRNYLLRVKESKRSSSVVARMMMCDGTYQWTEITGHVELNENNKFRRLTGILRNVNPEWEKQREELKNALSIAEKANAAKTSFLSRISHDMRTPLNGILGLATLMKDKVTSPELQEDLVELELSGEYLLNLINDTLDMNRIESGKLELNPIVCYGRSVFNNALGLAQTAAKKKNIKINVTEENIPFTLLYIDSARMEQIVMNIVGNAIKFSPEGGTIDITISNISVENNVITDKLVVKDYGIGMSPEFLPHIFEAFSQEDGSKTSIFQGTGLGMSITKQLVQSMGGDITVKSELGKGSEFTIVLKFDIATEEQIECWKRNRMGLNHGVSLVDKHILLCEDHPLNAKIAIRLLESKGVIIEHAVNGKIGVEKFMESKEYYYDAILMDIRMPEMDGLEATRTIRKLDRNDAKHIPIIAMTANAFEDDIKETRDAGMDAHLSKPIQTKELYNLLEKLLYIDEKMHRQKVLVVDDAEINRDAIKLALNDDYEILEASNGQEALDILSSVKGINAVITDVQMPTMDGLELIKAIRSNDQNRHIVIIANTQFGDPEQEEQLLELGANDFVYKPTTPKIVEIRVRNALRRM